MANPEGAPNLGINREPATLGRAERVVGERLKEMKARVERAEAMQKNFIFKIAQPLNEDEAGLLSRAKAYIGEFFEKKFNQLGAKVLGDQGSEVKGLQFDGKIGEVSCCAARRAMFNFKRQCKPGEKIQALSEARRDQVDSGAFKRNYTESVGPCALCRDALSSLNKDAKVIQPIGGEVKTVPVSFMYPSRKFLAGEETMNDTEKEYRELLLSISKDFPITANDQAMLKRAENELADKVNSGPEKEVMLVSARGFSGESYSNDTPKLIRNPQSLVIDKPVEFQLVCESAENQDQVLTLVVLKGKQEGSQQYSQKVMLPAGVSRELIRQFHPLATVIVDFGKEGLGKLPIEILYPLVYKLRKRKNGN